MDTKKVPLFVMLLAASVACIVTYIYHYSFHDTLVVLIIVLILFLILGVIVKKLLDKFEISKDDTVDDEGEVVEKSANGEEADENITDQEGEASAGEEVRQDEAEAEVTGNT